MDNLIFKAIIEITRQRDMDALESAFLMSLSEIFPTNNISLYKSFNNDMPDNLKEIFHISLSGNNGKFNTNKKLVAADIYIKKCFQSASIVRYETDNGLSNALYPVFIDKKVAGAMHIEHQDNKNPDEKPIELFIKILNNHLTVLNESERDKLTELLNRRTFDNRLNNLLEAQRQKQTTYDSPTVELEKRQHKPECCSWLAMMDIDNFKRINDTHGHLFGDEVILMLSQHMKRFFRYTDLLFRFGGEEFIVILEPTSDDMAKQTFERFADVVANHVFPQIGNITISTGYARITTNDYPHALLDRADKALYYAKKNGKNCVHNYEELLTKGQLSERKTTDSSTTFFDN